MAGDTRFNRNVAIVVEGHSKDEYNGYYNPTGRLINGRVAYENQHRRVFFHYFRLGHGARRWSFDDRPLNGQHDWFHGGWSPPLPGGSIPFGRRTWSISPEFGEDTVELTLTPAPPRSEQVTSVPSCGCYFGTCVKHSVPGVIVAGHPNESYNGTYVEQPGRSGGLPVYVSRNGQVLYHYCATGAGAGDASWSLDDRVQDGQEDWFHGGWVSAEIGEPLPLGRREWSLSATEGESVVSLFLRLAPGTSHEVETEPDAEYAPRQEVDLRDRLGCGGDSASLRAAFGDTHYYRLCREAAPGTLQSIGNALPPSIADCWYRPTPDMGLGPGAAARGVEGRAAWFWTTNVCYQQVNRAVIEDDAAALESFGPLIRSINSYITHNAVAEDATVWRGSDMDEETYAAYQEGEHYRFSMFHAYSESEETAWRFATRVLVCCTVPARCRSAAFLGPVSAFSHEDELILAPYTVGGCVCKGTREHKGRTLPYIEFAIARDSGEFAIRSSEGRGAAADPDPRSALLSYSKDLWR